MKKKANTFTTLTKRPQLSLSNDKTIHPEHAETPITVTVVGASCHLMVTLMVPVRTCIDMTGALETLDVLKLAKSAQGKPAAKPDVREKETQGVNGVRGFALRDSAENNATAIYEA